MKRSFGASLARSFASAARNPRRANAILLGIALFAIAMSTTKAWSIDGFAGRRAAMVRRIRSDVNRMAPSAVNDDLERSLAAINTVPREDFVPTGLRKRAYGSIPLPIGHAQTVTDVETIALMTAALRLPEHANVLDVGTGSGYQAAVLARLAERVSSVEIVEPLAASAGERLRRLGFANVDVRARDGFAGWSDHAPFDGVVVAAGAAQVSQPLIDQLKVGGRLVMPIGPSWATEQVLVVTKTGATTTTRCSLGWTMFVPLTGQGMQPARAMGLLQEVPLCYEHPVLYPTFMTPRVAADTAKRSPDNARADGTERP